METIEIRNFGPIPYVSLDIKRLTILIGTQGSGKSTISKLLTIFRDRLWHINVINCVNERAPFLSFKIDKYFRIDTYLRYTFGDVVITYQEGSFSYINGSLSRQQQLDQLRSQIGNKCFPIIKKMGFSDVEEMTDMSDFRLLAANCRSLLYIPAERIMASQLVGSLASIHLAQVPLGYPILEYMSFFEKAQKYIPMCEIPFLDVKVENKEGTPYVIAKDGSSLPLDACSSGVQSALPLIMVMNYCCQEHYFDSFVVEEPEQNLFPVNQKELLRQLVSLWKTQCDKNANLVITTHSPYTLTCVNVEILAYIVGQNLNYAQAVREIIPESEWLNPDEVSVYALNQEKEAYATNLINPKTNLIGANTIDAVSEIIGAEYAKLYKLYIKQLKE